MRRRVVIASLVAPATNTGDAAGDSYVSIGNLTGSHHADFLSGNAGASTLNGGAGADHLNGRSGDDRLLGGGGLDTLTGGPGKDTFVFDQPLLAGNVATITDFSHADDSIALSLADFGAAGGVGPVAPGAFYAGSAAHDADDRIIYNSANGKLSYDADGNATNFAIGGAHLHIDASDFSLF
jgi:Ca2+-binding RTX toxin-like protein